MTRDERDWWKTLDAKPGDITVVGMFADWLEERGHPWAHAMRYAFDRRLAPVKVEVADSPGGVFAMTALLFFGDTPPWVYWAWEESEFKGPDLTGSNHYMPRWLKPRGGWRQYKAPSTAYQSFAKRFRHHETNMKPDVFSARIA